MLFKEMKEEDRKALIEGHEDLLTPLVDADKPIYEGASCPQCGGAATKAFDLVRTLSGNRPIPRYNCKCLVCDCHFEPISGLIVEAGKSQAIDPVSLVPIINPEGYGH